MALCAIGNVGRTAEVVKPFPRERLPAPVMWASSLDAGHDGWTAIMHCSLAAAGGALVVTSSGDDPSLESPAIAPAVSGPMALRLRMRSTSDGEGQVFWATRRSPHWAEAHSARFPIVHDGQWRDYEVPFESAEAVTRLRLDPGRAAGEATIDLIELRRALLHPLEIDEIHSTDREIRVLLRNHSARSIEASVAGRPWQVPASGTQELLVDAAGDAPFKMRQVKIESPGLPPLLRNAMIVRESAKADWLVRHSGDARLEIARDGSGVRWHIGGKLSAVVAPLVHRDGVVPALSLSERDDDIRFTGEGVAVTLRLQAGALAVSIESDTPCEGPVLRPLGSLEAGLFAGLEFLGRGESSSSTLDIETAEHLRFAPDPMKVTMPLMACRSDRGVTAMTWRNMRLQPVFAAPNFLDAAPGQRMALRGKRIEALLRVSGGELDQAILWAVAERGLPPLPARPRSAKEQTALSLSALNGPLRSADGWGHCAEPNWGRQPYADMASAMFRLTGAVPDLPRLVPGGSHIHDDAIYFLSGRADQWRQLRSERAAALLAEQRSDGSFRYDGPLARGHFEDTASGYVAERAATLLDHAWLTGDRPSRDAGIKSLEYMKRFGVPRGAQIWEVPLHTPDLLAAAHLVRAYVRGYELTGKRAYVDLARRWAVYGIPFVYLWGERPIMSLSQNRLGEGDSPILLRRPAAAAAGARRKIGTVPGGFGIGTMPYSTIAVYGATQWQAPNWMGLPVQWCGVVYACELVNLAPLDRSFDWRKLAEGILIAAEQMQYPDGPLAGCLPDSFSLATQRRNGPAINPCAVLSLRRALEGQSEGLHAAHDGRHWVAGPLPLAIKDDAAVVEGAAGMRYQLLVDGSRIIDVQSQGRDRVALD